MIRDLYIGWQRFNERPVYTTANFGYGTDKNSTGTKK